MIDKYYKGNNFWDVNPEFRSIELFDSFYKTDASKNKERSSSIMWAIAFCLRRESPMYNLPNKWELASSDIAGIKDITKHEDLINMFKQCNLSQAERSMLAWEELMFKRDKYLKEQEYFFDYIDENGKMQKGTAEQMDKAFSVTPKMYSDYFKIKKELDEDDIKRGKGNKPKSLSDAGEI